MSWWSASFKLGVQFGHVHGVSGLSASFNLAMSAVITSCCNLVRLAARRSPDVPSTVTIGRRSCAWYLSSRRLDRMASLRQRISSFARSRNDVVTPACGTASSDGAALALAWGRSPVVVLASAWGRSPVVVSLSAVAASGAVACQAS
jgi:hypothetical protein